MAAAASRYDQIAREREMAYEMIWEPHGVYKRFHGFVTASEFLASIVKLQGDRRFDAVRYSINDFLSVEGHDVSPGDVKKFAAYGMGAAKSNPNIRIAAITADETLISLLRLYASPPLSPYPLAVFASLVDARHWLATAPAG